MLKCCTKYLGCWNAPKLIHSGTPFILYDLSGVWKADVDSSNQLEIPEISQDLILEFAAFMDLIYSFPLHCLQMEAATPR
jgi:hypothetical protein